MKPPTWRIGTPLTLRRSWSPAVRSAPTRTRPYRGGRQPTRRMDDRGSRLRRRCRRDVRPPSTRRADAEQRHRRHGTAAFAHRMICAPPRARAGSPPASNATRTGALLTGRLASHRRVEAKPRWCPASDCRNGRDPAVSWLEPPLLLAREARVVLVHNRTMMLPCDCGLHGDPRRTVRGLLGSGAWRSAGPVVACT